MHYQTFPDAKSLADRVKEIPEYMRPNQIPYVAMVEGYLNDAICDSIVEEFEKLEPYQLSRCGAMTRECNRPLSSLLRPLEHLVKHANLSYWGYDLDDNPAAWFQTYGPGDAYELHIDGSACQMRKLTGLLLLSDPSDYEGGDLIMYMVSDGFTVPKTRGTVVVFPYWFMHEVTTVTRGKRQSMNMGFFGPPFR